MKVFCKPKKRCDVCQEKKLLHHQCNECGHGICKSCFMELSRQHQLKDCFWWSCSRYGFGSTFWKEFGQSFMNRFAQATGIPAERLQGTEPGIVTGSRIVDRRSGTNPSNRLNESHNLERMYDTIQLQNQIRNDYAQRIRRYGGFPHLGTGTNSTSADSNCTYFTLSSPADSTASASTNEVSYRIYYTYT